MLVRVQPHLSTIETRLVAPRASAPRPLVPPFTHAAPHHVARRTNGAGLSRRPVLTHFKEDAATPQPVTTPAGQKTSTARSILIGVDLSPESDTAVDWAVSNLLKEGDALHLFHLVQGVKTDQIFSTPSGHMIRINNSMTETMEDQLRKYAATKAQELNKHYKPYIDQLKVSLKTHVVPLPNASNKAALGQALCEQAEVLNAAVVVLASHSQGGITEFIRGSVSDWAVKHCTSPVAILHDTKKRRSTSAQSTAEGAKSTTSTPRQLVVAVDATESSFAACQWILDNIYKPGDVVHLTHVVPSLPLNSNVGDFLATPGGPIGFETDPEIQLQQAQVAEQEAKEWQQTQATRYQEMMEQAGAEFTFDTAVVATDDPVTAISDFICHKAEELKAAAVVLNYHEHSALFEFFLGSVTNQVTHRCSRPVVVLHNKQLNTPSSSAIA